MRNRDSRLATARKESDRCARELKRDLRDLERRETQLMQMLRHQIKRGDVPKSKMVAKQIAYYRNVADSNFSRSLYLQSEVQLRKSTHRINQSHVEFLKGMRFANARSSIKDARKSMQKYAQRQDEMEIIEDMLKEGFESIYDNLETERLNPAYFDEQVSGIFREAIDPKLKVREYQLEKNDILAKYLQNVSLRLRVFGDPENNIAEVAVPTLEVSVDMLKRLIYKDEYALCVLNLPKMSHITLGNRVYDESLQKEIFSSYASTDSLKHVGLKDQGTVWIYMQETNDSKVLDLQTRQ